MESTINWICPRCGVSNGLDDACECGGNRPDYGAHMNVLAEALSVNNGTVFNAPAVIHVHGAGHIEDHTDLDPGQTRELVHGRFTSILIQMVFWSSMAVIGVMICLFTILFLAGMFGWT